MAVKKTTTKASGASRATPKTAAPTKAAPKKASGKAPAAKAATPKPAQNKPAAPKKKAAPVKLTDRQLELLKKVQETRDVGYLGSKAEAKSLESLTTKKLLKRGAKDKASGNFKFSVSKAGEKPLSNPSA